MILGVVALAAAGSFVLRQRRTDHPLYDLHLAARPTFWVAALAGVILFGSLMGAMLIGQQFVQNGLGFLLVGTGVGFAGTPASRSLTGSVPVRKAGQSWLRPRT
ncbi:MAG TPA: hypothetical protein VGC32_03405 [Solirubrobacterales bacterium]